MKYIGIILGFLLLGCELGEFPDTIKSSLSDEHFRIKGTKLFVRDIDGFRYIQDINIFKQSDSVYIHCLYTPGNFQQDFINQKFDFYHNKNYQIISNKSFTINGNNGVYYKLKEGNSYWLYFIFGDTLAENRIVATFPENKSLESSIYEFVKNAYYKWDFDLNPQESAKFDFNPLSSNFQFVSYSINSYVFMQKPKRDNVRPNNLFFTQMPPIKDTIQLKRTLDNVIEHIKGSGITIQNISIDSNFKVDSNFAYNAIISGDFENKRFYNRMIITSNSMTGLLFGVSLYNDIEQNLAVTDSILRTVKITK